MNAKRTLCLLLCFFLLPFFPPAAQADESAYIPGRTTEALVRSALLSGDMLLADANITLDLNPGMFGLTDEDAAAVGMVCDVLKDCILTAGAARIDGGAALLLRAAYGEEAADVALSLTQSGAAIETSLLPGERLVLHWNDLLQASGLNESERAMLLSLRDIDPQQLAQLAAHLLGASQTLISMTAAPYIRIIEDFIAALPVQTQSDVAAEGYFPAAKRESILIITQKAAGELLAALAARLEQDILLRSALDGLLASAGETTLDSAALCAAVCEAAAGMTDEQHPLFFITGYNEALSPVYYSLCTSDESGVSYAINLIDKAEDVVGEGQGMLLQAFVSDSDTYSGLTATFISGSDPADASIRTIGAAAEVQLNNEYVFSGEYILSTSPSVTEDGHPAHDAMQEYVFDALVGGSVLSASGTTMTQRGQTDGGEYTVFSSGTQGYLGEMQIMQTGSQTSFTIEETENGLAGSYVSQYTAPQQGVDNAELTCSIYTLPYAPDADPAALDLLRADGEALDALALRLQQSAESLLFRLIDRLPEALRQQIPGMENTQETTL